jgi:hypothetical protein
MSLLMQVAGDDNVLAIPLSRNTRKKEKNHRVERALWIAQEGKIKNIEGKVERIVVTT